MSVKSDIKIRSNLNDYEGLDPILIEALSNLENRIISLEDADPKILEYSGKERVNDIKSITELVKNLRNELIDIGYVEEWSQNLVFQIVFLATT